MPEEKNIIHDDQILISGYSVTDTMRKSVVDVSIYNDTPKELLYGQVATLGGKSYDISALRSKYGLPLTTRIVHSRHSRLYLSLLTIC